MKLSIITSTSIVALAAAALIAGGASAAPNSPDAEKQCVDEGGRVKDGTCVVPEGPPQPAEETSVKSSKSNSSERTGNFGGPPQPAGTAKLNLSKSNINRIGDTSQPVEATTVKSTKANTSDRTGCPAGQQINAETNECTADSAASPTPQ